MRVVLGVDPKRRYSSALRLMGRMAIPGLEVDALLVLEPVREIPAVTPTPSYRQLFMLNDEEAAKIVDAAVQELHEFGIAGRGDFCLGSPPVELEELADKVQADWIAVGSEEKGAWGSLFFGSVTRSLAIYSRRSFLVAKGTPSATGPLRAVIATDHSPYCRQAIDGLLANWPPGIREVSIITADWVDLPVFTSSFAEAPDPSIYQAVLDWGSGLASKSEELRQRFLDLGIAAEASVVRAEPRDAISTEMARTQADLLIMAARGRGILERLTLGSTAMHVVTAQPHSVLVLRNSESSK